jgi:hypothetical protein
MCGAARIVLVLQLAILLAYSQELPQNPAQQITDNLPKVSPPNVGDNLINATNPAQAGGQVPQVVNAAMANATNSVNSTQSGANAEDKEWYNPMTWFN